MGGMRGDEETQGRLLNPHAFAASGVIEIADSLRIDSAAQGVRQHWKLIVLNFAVSPHELATQQFSYEAAFDASDGHGRIVMELKGFSVVRGDEEL